MALILPVIYSSHSLKIPSFISIVGSLLPPGDRGVILQVHPGLGGRPEEDSA